MKNGEPKSVSEAIILLQSVLLMAVATAGLSATSSVTAMYNALTNANSSAYIITDNSVVTETETISTEECFKIVTNFEFINTCIFLIGLTIFICSLIRILRITFLQKR